ncbi:MAG: GNAT family N-acetyltransferase [Phycisphaerales bacterium]
MRHEIRIRAAEPRDVAAIAELNAAMAWETERTQLCQDTLTRGVQAVLDDPQHGFYIVAEHSNDVVGCLMVTFEWSDWRCGRFWWIQSLYVRPPFRRRGVFRQLHEFVKAEALRQPEVCGLRLYVEHSNHVAQQVYEQIGMRPLPYRMYEQKLPR